MGPFQHKPATDVPFGISALHGKDIETPSLMPFLFIRTIMRNAVKGLADEADL